MIEVAGRLGSFLEHLQEKSSSDIKPLENDDQPILHLQLQAHLMDTRTKGALARPLRGFAEGQREPDYPGIAPIPIRLDRKVRGSQGCAGVADESSQVQDGFGGQNDLPVREDAKTVRLVLPSRAIELHGTQSNSVARHRSWTGFFNAGACALRFVCFLCCLFGTFLLVMNGSQMCGGKPLPELVANERNVKALSQLEQALWVAQEELSEEQS